jgi:hypothetical protein
VKEPRRARPVTPDPVSRPFEGLAAECDLVALREFVPSATATLTLAGDGRPVLLGTVLPMASAALVRDDAGEGLGMVGLQVQQVPGADLSRDLGAALQFARTANPGESLESVGGTVEAPRLQDLLVLDVPLEVTVHDDFGWWVPGDEPPTGEVALSLERANEAIMPTALVRADGVRSAWWVDAGEKAHLRWVRPEDEDALMMALARVHASGALTLGEGSRFAGSFRAHGLLVPVFDLDREMHAQEWAAATAVLGSALDEALAVDGPLTPAQRRSRDGLRARQVTIR